ncbi:hypothetical protein FNV64_05650 [Streptomyces sp. S1A1-7]|nr:hypothetical protein FNV64_05650 [Streptomyces sp. S1A1-7]
MLGVRGVLGDALGGGDGRGGHDVEVPGVGGQRVGGAGDFEHHGHLGPGRKPGRTTIRLADPATGLGAEVTVETGSGGGFLRARVRFVNATTGSSNAAGGRLPPLPRSYRKEGRWRLLRWSPGASRAAVAVVGRDACGGLRAAHAGDRAPYRFVDLQESAVAGMLPARDHRSEAMDQRPPPGHGTYAWSLSRRSPWW